MSEHVLSGNIVSVKTGRIFKGEVLIRNGVIAKITEKSVDKNHYILPGLVDAHVHIESSMLTPSQFARLAVVHGTVATVSDPHEIGNVLGVSGVEYMLNDGERVPLKFYFGAPSCVPATGFETAGAEITVEDIDKLLSDKRIVYLSEMMNWPGVLFSDPVVMAKIAVAKSHGKPIDGHAPGLLGTDAKNYAAAGISTDHECFTLEEAQDKLAAGMKIIIREGSAAKNFEALVPLLKTNPNSVMFCSDDKHPNDLVEGHINQLLARAVKSGADVIEAVRAATLNPAKHYGLDIGLLSEGDKGDVVIFEDIKDFRVLETYIDGECVARDGKALFEVSKAPVVNNFNCQEIAPRDLIVKPDGATIRVIEAIPGELVSKELHLKAKIEDGNTVSDVSRDILKLVVINRYNQASPAVAFVKNIGLKTGALASSVAHDCHNIVAVGVTDEEITTAINSLIKVGGGISVVDGDDTSVLPLPVAGIMTTDDGYQVANDYELLDAKAKALGSTLPAPFMTLSFLALLVIPQLKLSDKGLFDGDKFEFAPLFL